MLYAKISTDIRRNKRNNTHKFSQGWCGTHVELIVGCCCCCCCCFNCANLTPESFLVCTCYAVLLYSNFVDPEFYPFGSDKEDKKLLPGIVTSESTSAELKLPSKFPFFGRDEDTLYVSFKVEKCMFRWIES